MPTLAGVDRLLTPEQVGLALDLPAPVIHRFIRCGLLECYQLAPGLLRVRAGDLARFVADHPWLCAVVR